MPKTTTESIQSNSNQEYTEEIIRKVFVKNKNNKGGGSLGVVIPKEVSYKMDLQQGNYVFIKANKDVIMIRKLEKGAQN